jgi:hypothetical protein
MSDKAFGLGRFALSLAVMWVSAIAVSELAGAGLLGICGPYGPEWAVDLELISIILGPIAAVVLARASVKKRAMARDPTRLR